MVVHIAPTQPLNGSANGRTMDHTDDRRTKLLQRKHHIERKLAGLDARERERERKRDTRRKIIAGAIVLKHAEMHPHFASRLYGLIDQFVNDRDRHLFDLEDEPIQTPKLKATFASAAKSVSDGTGGSMLPPDHTKPRGYSDFENV